jgi:cytochrome c
MKKVKLTVICLLAVCLAVSAAYAMKHLPEERGKALFENSSFAGGKKSCNSCHPEGRGLGQAAAKKEFRIMGKSQKSLEEAVNFCIVNANKGKAIDENSQEMKDIVAFIKSLGSKAPGYK